MGVEGEGQAREHGAGHRVGQLTGQHLLHHGLLEKKHQPKIKENVHIYQCIQNEFMNIVAQS